MFRRILVPLDGSTFAEGALPVAATLARMSGGKLRLVSVEDSVLPSLNEAGWTFEDETGVAVSSTAERYLERTRERIQAGGASVSSALREGAPSDGILREAEAFGADLIVMATHGRTGLDRFWLGSVAQECARQGHRPVLLIRPAQSGQRPIGEFAIGRVVVPLDSSEFAERALRPAMELANLFGASIELVRVVYDLTVADSEFFPQTVARTDQIVAHEQAAALAYLEKVAEPVRAMGLTVSTSAPSSAEAAVALVNRAGTDLIVMVTHSRSGLAKAFLGSVTEAVSRSAAGPVLVIPPLGQPQAQPKVHGSAPFAGPGRMVPLGM